MDAFVFSSCLRFFRRAIAQRLAGAVTVSGGILIAAIALPMLSAANVGTATSVPRPALPDPSPLAVLVRTIQPRLHAETPASFAGLARAADGALEIYVVGADSRRVAAIVGEAQAASGAHVPVRLVAGRQHSLVDLEALRDRITAAQPRLKAGGVVLTEWAVDIRANKVRIGVLDLDPAKGAQLGQEFGADRIEVVAGGYYDPAARAVDSPPYYGALEIYRGTTRCTSGYNVVFQGVANGAMTAGHCGAGEWTQAGVPMGTTFLRQYGGSQRGDMQYFSASVAGFIWIDGANVGGVTTYTTANTLGDPVCANGISSGEVCGSTVIEIDGCYGFTDGQVVCGLNRAFNCCAISLGSGDSGGPDYSYNGDGSINVEGLSSASWIPDPHYWIFTPAQVVALEFGAIPMHR